MSCDCANCRKDNILNGTIIDAQCSVCSTVLTSTSKFDIMPDKNLVCSDCIATHYILCPSCKKFHKKSDSKKITRKDGNGIVEIVHICERCFTNNFRECQECHGYFDKHDIMGQEDKTYCRSCFDKSYKLCVFCNHVFPKVEVTHTIRGGKLACDKCYSYYGPIEIYETKPEPSFYGTPPHYYGIESEVELLDGKRTSRGQKSEEVYNLFPEGFVILKEDGSLRCGFEICTQPATVAEHIRLWDKFFDDLPENLHSYTTNNCGLHIHCSRKPLSLLTIAKIVVFVNDDDNRTFIETIAGRKSNSYSSIDKKEYNIVRRDPSRSRRYEAVNLANKETIEFRIFKGTLKRESFYKAIEFCDALIRFCMTGAHGIAYCRNKENFINFVATRQKDYPHLYAFICAKILKQITKLTTKYGFNIEEQSTSTTRPNN